MAKAKKSFDNQEFFRPTSFKVLIFVILLMLLTSITLKTTYPRISDMLLIVNTLLNILVIIFFYLIACFAAMFLKKRR
jgi:hypothetical protein